MTSESPHSRDTGSQRFRVAGNLVDPAACRLERAGKEIHIEPKVMELLALLAARRGTVVSRRELEDSVWANTVVGHKAVSNAIIKLRKALGDDPRDPQIIETIPKRGYRLVAEVTPDSGEGSKLAGVETNRTERGGHTTASRDHKLLTGTLGVLIIVAGLGWWQPWMSRVEPTSPEHTRHLLPDKPSIAVLPFDNLSGDRDKKYLSEGISENIITELSRFKKFFVIARGSSFAYRDAAASIQQIAEDLGVRYVLVGSMQTANERVRVTAQLIDAISGKHLWAERFEGDLKDIFEVQDRITRIIAATMEENIDLAEYERIRRKPTDSLTAYEHVKRALAQLLTVTREGNERAKRLYETALALDPTYSNAYAGLAWVYMNAYQFGWSESHSRDELLRLALEMANKAVEHDPFNPKAYQALAQATMLSGDLDQAIVEYDRALELNPNSARVLASSSEPLIYLGRAREAVSRIKTAIRLSPRHPDWYLWNLGVAQYCAKQYEEAIASVKRMKQLPNGARRVLAAALVRSDRLEEAQAVIAQFLRNAPEYSLESIKQLPFKYKEYQERMLKDLRKAGVPESPSRDEALRPRRTPMRRVAVLVPAMETANGSNIL